MGGESASCLWRGCRYEVRETATHFAVFQGAGAGLPFRVEPAAVEVLAPATEFAQAEAGESLPH